MNLIAFPHYTCGGLLCDILNNQWSPVGSRGNIGDLYHSLGKIGDSDSIYDDYDQNMFNDRIDAIKDKVPSDGWISTHVWPNLIDNTLFDKIILVTTETYRSKIYRWVRCCHHYYESSQPWIDAKQSTVAYIDKVRETAKNYIKPFRSLSGTNTINLEFSDIVESAPAFINVVSHCDWQKQMTRWRGINDFLYSDDLWNSFYVKRFHEAEYETLTGLSYVYQ